MVSPTGKQYVGITSNGIVSRWFLHWKKARVNPVSPLHKEMATHPDEKDWLIFCIETTNNPLRHNLYIKTYNTVENGLNQTYSTVGNRLNAE